MFISSDYNRRRCGLSALQTAQNAHDLLQAQEARPAPSLPISFVFSATDSAFLQPMPQWDSITGNLRTLPSLLEKLPKGSMQSDAFTLLSYAFEQTENCFYIDLWPFSSPLLVITSPELAMQACGQEHDLPKPAVLIPFFALFAGGRNLFDTNGAEWKRSRTLFNPGFSAQVMMECTPHIIDEASVYVALLRKHAKRGDTFSLDGLTCDYMMDVIGVICM
jgi:cytochrome P450